MTTAIPFVPTPRLDYTMRYNEAKDDYRIYQQERQREQDRNEKIFQITFLTPTIYFLWLI